ncbi:MAG: HAD family hydrolase [Chloroflexi bacterium]|nr:HAD family hydrolase [Chloroflexota bacterium]
MIQLSREELEVRAKQLKLLVLDVDGVLTEGELLLIGEDMEAKRFYIHDGMGIIFLRTAGIKIAIITGRVSPMVRRRAKELKIDEVSEGAFYKQDGVESLLEKLEIQAHEVGYVGDDIHDVPAMKIVGLPISVANARPEAKAHSVYVTEAAGGHGAVRELAEWLLELRGEKESIFAQFLQTRQEKEANSTPEASVDALPTYSITDRPSR